MFHIIPGYYGNVSLYLFCKTISERASCYIKPWPAAGWQGINKMFWSDSGANTQWKNVFFLGTKFSRHPEGLSFTGLRFSGKYRFPFRKVQIFISQSTDFHFAKYRFSFRKVQISFRKVQIFISQSTDFISQSTDFHFAKYRFHFAKYRFSFRKVQISFRFVSFRFAKYNKPFVRAFTYVFFPSDFFFNFLKSKRIIWTLLLCNKRYRSPCSFERNEHLLSYLVSWREISFVAAHLRALQWRENRAQKWCAMQYWGITQTDNLRPEGRRFSVILLSWFDLNLSRRDETFNQLSSNFRFVCVVH